MCYSGNSGLGESAGITDILSFQQGGDRIQRITDLPRLSAESEHSDSWR